MALTDWVQTVSLVYFGWQQNRIFKKQNEIFAAQGQQGGQVIVLPDKTSRLLWLRRYWPTVIMGLLFLITAYDIYDRHHNAAPIVEFDAPNQPIPMVQSFGLRTDGCMMNINASDPILMDHKDEYDLAIGCFLYDQAEDVLDAPNLQVSQLYDIRTGKVIAAVKFSQQFNDYRQQTHATGIHIALLLVPKGVRNTQFATLRQARALKVRILTLALAQSGGH
jgi:hypothetical protein